MLYWFIRDTFVTCRYSIPELRHTEQVTWEHCGSTDTPLVAKAGIEILSVVSWRPTALDIAPPIKYNSIGKNLSTAQLGWPRALKPTAVKRIEVFTHCNHNKLACMPPIGHRTLHGGSSTHQFTCRGRPRTKTSFVNGRTDSRGL